MIARRHEAGRSAERSVERVRDRGAALANVAAGGRRPRRLRTDRSCRPRGRTTGAARRARDDVDGAAERVRAVQRRSAPRSTSIAFDRFERHGNVGVVMPGLRVVQADAVHHHQRLAESGAADAEIRLHAVRPARPHLDARKQAQDVVGIRNRQLRDLFARDDIDAASHVAERRRRHRTGHDHGLLCARRRGRLCGWRDEACEEIDCADAGEMQTCWSG